MKFIAYSTLIFLLSISVSAQVAKPESTDAGSGRPPTFSQSSPYEPRVFAASEKSRKKEKEKIQQTLTPSNLKGSNEPISLYVSVLDARGQPVTGLTRDNFKLFVDGAESDIASVESASGSVNYFFLLDTSPSNARTIETIRETALRIAGQLAVDDKAMIMRFDGKLRIVCELTSDRALVERCIRKATSEFGDGTSLYDAVGEVSEKIVPRSPGRNAVFLFTDGVDTTSQKSGYESSLRIAEGNDAALSDLFRHLEG